MAVLLANFGQQFAELAQCSCRLAGQRKTGGFPKLAVAGDLPVRAVQIVDNPTVRGRRGTIVAAVEQRISEFDPHGDDIGIGCPERLTGRPDQRCQEIGSLPVGRCVNERSGLGPGSCELASTV